jgi:hypothetical protein
VTTPQQPPAAKLTRRRWRLRISTLMFLVVIVALAVALVIDRRNYEWKLAHLEARLAEAKLIASKYAKALDASEHAMAKFKAGATGRGPSDE